MGMEVRYYITASPLCDLGKSFIAYAGLKYKAAKAMVGDLNKHSIGFHYGMHEIMNGGVI